MKVPITFEHKGKIYAGQFSSVNGASSDMWHLVIDKYYQGQMF